MELAGGQFSKIASFFPKKRGTVGLSDHQVFNAILFVAENGSKWRALPKEFDSWHTIYTRMNRWTKKGVLDQIFKFLQELGITKVRLEVLYLDSTSIKVSLMQGIPHGAGALKKTIRNALVGHVEDGQPSHMVAADGQRAVGYSLKPP